MREHIALDETRKQLLSAMGFSEKAIAVLDQNLNIGAIDNPTVKAQHQGSCGDIMILSMKVNNQIIEDAKYEYVGCAGLQSCASALTEIIKGKDINQAKSIEAEELVEYLGGIPENKFECAEIARDTLRKAIKELEA